MGDGAGESDGLTERPRDGASPSADAIFHPLSNEILTLEDDRQRILPKLAGGM